MSEIQYTTAEGLAKLKAELEHLKKVERPSLSKQIGEARDKGDLSENAEYDAAKEAQGLLELKISKLENSIGIARVMEDSQIDRTKVSALSKVKIKNVKNGMEMQYILVSEQEADLKQGKISVKSPIAMGIMGLKVGQVAKVEVPNGEMEFEILDIT
ncbi:MAG: transcription elongation factor GreA [Sphingobacteriales bacterium]|jgi:transcription elongation factor GreA